MNELRLKSINLSHHGDSESVQNGLMHLFAGVFAIEISMEHELMNSDAGVTFEDVMELCDVHANLFKHGCSCRSGRYTNPGHPKFRSLNRRT